MGHVIPLGEGGGELHSGSCLDSLKERDRLADLVIDGKIILKGFLFKMVACGLDTPGSGQGQVAESGRNSNEHSGIIK